MDYKDDLRKLVDDPDPFWDWSHLYRARTYSFGGSMVSAMVSALGSVASYFKHMKVAGKETALLFQLAFTTLWHMFVPQVGGFSLVKMSIGHMERVIKFIPKHPRVVAHHIWACEHYAAMVKEEEEDAKSDTRGTERSK